MEKGPAPAKQRRLRPPNLQMEPDSGFADCLLGQTSSISQLSDISSRNSGLRYRITEARTGIRSRRTEKEMNRQIWFIGGDKREKVGRLTSIKTFSRRSAGATR